MARLFVALALALCAGSALAVCPNDCNGHGACNKYSMCECYRNWMAADCSERVCRFGVAFVDTPQGDLNADGYVSAATFETQKGNAKAWEIYPWYAGWGGANYKFSAWSGASATMANGWLMTRTGSAQGEAHMYKECSAKGTCNRGSGQCTCFAGYEGEACARIACPSDCSGHGVCMTIAEIENEVDTGYWGESYVDSWYGANGYDGTKYTGWDRHKTQACHCDPGFFGDDCSNRECPKGDDPVTKYTSYTRIKLVDDTNTNWYDKQACPVAQHVTTVASSLVISGSGPYIATVDTAGVGYDDQLGKDAVKIATIATGGGGTSEELAAMATQELDEINIGGTNLLTGGWGNVIPVGATLRFKATSITGTNVNTNAQMKLTFGAPNAFAFNSKSRYNAGLLPTRIWSWEKPGSGDTEGFLLAGTTLSGNNFASAHQDVPLTQAPAGGYLWNGWYSPYDDATGKPKAPGSGGSAEAECAHQADPSDNCKYKNVSYLEAADRGQSVGASGKATVTGTASMASGSITDGCCGAASVQDCTQCNFFDVLLSDVEGTFNTGDTLRVNWPRMDLLNALGTADYNYYDQNGFALCNYIESISTYYAANAGNVQVNEVQVLQIRYDDAAAFDGYFALEFEDEFGDVWTTEAVAVAGESDVTGAASAGTVATESDVLAGRIEAALEALPNKVLEDVVVAYVEPTVGGSAPTPLDERAALRHFTISFVSNTGDIPTLGVAYSVYDDEAYSSGGHFSPGFGGTTSDDNKLQVTDPSPDGYYNGWTIAFANANAAGAASGQSKTITAYVGSTKAFTPNSAINPDTGSNSVYTLTNPVTTTGKVSTNSMCGGYESVARLPQSCTAAHSGGALSSITCADYGSGMFEFVPTLHVGRAAAATAIIKNGSLFGITVTTAGSGVTNADPITFSVPSTYTPKTYREGCVPVGTLGVGTGYTIPFSTQGDPEVGLVQVLAGNAASTGGSVAAAVKGTTENVECSNRGICDYKSGACKCFAGFTTEDCSVQNSLAMG